MLAVSHASFSLWARILRVRKARIKSNGHVRVRIYGTRRMEYICRIE